jgi:hypothetical protein
MDLIEISTNKVAKTEEFETVRKRRRRRTRTRTE